MKKRKYNFIIGERSAGRKHATLEYLRKISWSCRNVLSNEWYKALYGSKEDK